MDVCQRLNDAIDEANQKIKSHNLLVKNREREQAALRKATWKYLGADKLKAEVTVYSEQAERLNKAISALEEEIRKTKVELNQHRDKLTKLEKKITSTKPTVDAINAMLRECGFVNFTLATAEHDTRYRIVRPGGEDAYNTLSDGERSFVTFLYFYNWLKGSFDATGVNAPRIVVVDDPVSSVDSDVLFVVSHLLRQLIALARRGDSPIKQVIILTHNVFFHKEVAFDSKRQHNVSLNDETFWTIAKDEATSKVFHHEGNPIRSTYQWLWQELRDHQSGRRPLPAIALQNCLRRITETYFRLLGDQDPKKLCEKLPMPDQLICRSLFSWADDGSHAVHDEIDMSPDAVAPRYLPVFQRFFKLNKQEEHYRLMMGPDYKEYPESPVLTESST